MSHDEKHPLELRDFEELLEMFPWDDFDKKVASYQRGNNFYRIRALALLFIWGNQDAVLSEEMRKLPSFVCEYLADFYRDPFDHDDHYMLLTYRCEDENEFQDYLEYVRFIEKLSGEYNYRNIYELDSYLRLLYCPVSALPPEGSDESDLRQWLSMRNRIRDVGTVSKWRLYQPVFHGFKSSWHKKEEIFQTFRQRLIDVSDGIPFLVANLYLAKLWVKLCQMELDSVSEKDGLSDKGRPPSQFTEVDERNVRATFLHIAYNLSYKELADWSKAAYPTLDFANRKQAENAVRKVLEMTKSWVLISQQREQIIWAILNELHRLPETRTSTLVPSSSPQ